MYPSTSLLLPLLLVTASLQAGIYSWQDETGRTHFGDRPPPGSQAKPLKLRTNTYHSPEIKPLSGLASRDPVNVVIYSTEWCGVCKQAKRYFQTHKIPFTEYDVERTQRGRRDFRRLQGKGVPIILVGDQQMNGFSRTRFEAIYRGDK